MKLNFWQKILAWLLESILPGLIGKALAAIRVDDIVAGIRPWIKRVVEQIPQGFRPQLKDLLAKVGAFFVGLSEEIT